MDDEERVSPGLATVERRVRFELSRGRAAVAATSATAFFGPEIYGFVTAAMAGAAGVLDVYSSFVADLPRALRDFCWRCDLRVFLYHAARRALRRHREAGDRAGHPMSLQLPVPVRFARLSPHRRLRRLAIANLRRALPPDDRELLVLRLDRRLRWRELAVTSLGETAGETAIRAEARRLRERFSALRHLMKQLTLRSTDRSGLAGEDD